MIFAVFTAFEFLWTALYQALVLQIGRKTNKKVDQYSVFCSSALLVTILAEHKFDFPNSSNKFEDGLSVSS